jgi:hypothetical protein
MTVTGTIKKNPQYELRIFIRGLLDNAIWYKGKTVAVFEAVPKGYPRPYIVLEDCTWDNGSTKDKFEEDYVLKVGVYTDYGGTLDNCAIINVVYEILSTKYNAGELQFDTASDFCVTIFWFGSGETRVMRAEETGWEDDLERTMLDLMFRIKQLR